jgi:hypothetical protein
MHPVAIAFAVAVPAAFAAGVLYSKYVISEAASIKEHVTAEVQEVRADLASLLEKAAKKV